MHGCATPGPFGPSQRWRRAEMLEDAHWLTPGYMRRVPNLWRVAMEAANHATRSGRHDVKKVCIVGVSGKLGQYMAGHALERGYEVVGVCRAVSIDKLGELRERITVVPGATNDRDVIGRAASGCDGVLTVLVPIGREHYSSTTAQAVLDLAPRDARLIFSSGWH